MNLKLPQVGVELGPLWAQDQNDYMFQVGAHTHLPGSGVAITSPATNFTTDLSVAANLYGLRSARFTVQGAPLSGVADLACVYFSGSDLYANDAAGNQIRITAGGTLNAAALVSVLWPTQNVSTNIAIAPSNTNIAFLVDTTGARTITLPSSTAVSAGRLYVFSDKNGTSESNAITLTPGSGSDTIGAGGAGASITLKANFGAWIVIGDGAGHWHMLRSGSELNGSTVPRGGALTTGNVLQVSGASALTYAPLNLALAASTTGVLPAAQLGLATLSQSGAVQLTTDLGGSATSPQVINVTGVNSGVPFTLCSGGALYISLGSPDMRWPATTASPQLGILARTTSGAPTRVKVYGQTAYGPGAGAVAEPGGGIDYVSGASFGALSGDANVSGDHTFKVGPNIVAQILEVSTGHNFLSIGPTQPTTADLPAATSGNFGIYIRGTSSAPTAPSSSGTILWSTSSSLGIAPAGGTTMLEITNTTANFANSGGAGAPPAAVAGYLQWKINGATVKMPYYAV